MRAECGCLVEDGMVLHGFDGPCVFESRRHEPTEEDICAGGGHGYHGDDFPDRSDDGGRCYCGVRRYPAGGAA